MKFLIYLKIYIILNVKVNDFLYISGKYIICKQFNYFKGILLILYYFINLLLLYNQSALFIYYPFYYISLFI